MPFGNSVTSNFIHMSIIQGHILWNTGQKTTTPERWRKVKHRYARKELKKYFHIKLSAIKEQFTEENEKLAKRIEIDLQPKLLYRSNQVQYQLGNSAVALLDDLLKLLKR